MINNVVAGIVLYNPNMMRLKENILAIYPQCDKIIMVDNHSNNRNEIDNCWSDNKIHIIHNNDNLGIAKALNQLASYAFQNKYEWLLTLDQDSVSPSNLMNVYIPFTRYPKVGIICCKILDRNFGERTTEKIHSHGWEYVSQCITSASLLNLNAWNDAGKFCEKMFIDSVDFDLCYSLTEKGYRIIRTNDVALLHEVGHSRLVNFMGKEEQIYNHSPLRYYYIIRNSFLLGKRHHRFIYFGLRAIKRFLLVTIYERDQKKAKIKIMLRGFYHAMIGKYGKL